MTRKVWAAKVEGLLVTVSAESHCATRINGMGHCDALISPIISYFGIPLLHAIKIWPDHLRLSPKLFLSAEWNKCFGHHYAVRKMHEQRQCPS